MRISAGNILDSNCDGTNTKQEEANLKIRYKEMIIPMYRNQTANMRNMVE